MPYKDPEKKRERDREYHAENAEKRRAYYREYYAKNAEKIIEKGRKYRAKNPEKCRGYSRKYRAKNPEKRREYDRKYRAKNPEKNREGSRRHRARIRGALVNGHRVTDRKIEQIRMRFGWCCAACGKPLNDAAGHIDHFVPLARGGKHAAWNLVPLCTTCNTSKNASDPLDWLRRKRYVRSFTRRLIDSGHWIDHPHFRHINAPAELQTAKKGKK